MIFNFFYTIVLLCLLAACSGPSYYLQAISGHWDLMHARKDIQSLLNDPATSSELAEQLRAAEQIKAFAMSTLGLPANGSYSSYVEIDGETLVWNVIATEEFSLQAKKWCFPVAGCVPYRGYFKQQKAKEFATRLDDKGMDVFVSPAAAYSSLGWFNDPLLSTMLSATDYRLAAYLFHELAHQRLYIKNDGLFNESYASFVEKTGVNAWLEYNQRQHQLLQWQQLQNASNDFTELIAGVRAKLAGLYHSDETEAHKRELKAEIFNSLSLSHERLIRQKWHGKRYYAAWFEDPLNNARLALYNTYQGSHCAFQGLLDKAEGDLRVFHHLAEQKSRLKKDEREIWLKQKCVSLGTI